jgi:hypothetical protein
VLIIEIAAGIILSCVVIGFLPYIVAGAGIVAVIAILASNPALANALIMVGLAFVALRVIVAIVNQFGPEQRERRARQREQHKDLKRMRAEIRRLKVPKSWRRAKYTWGDLTGDGRYAAAVKPCPPCESHREKKSGNCYPDHGNVGAHIYSFTAVTAAITAGATSVKKA